MSDCPLCNENNHCAMENGEMPESCWCMNLKFPPELLEKASKDKACCICQKCIEKWNKKERC